MRKILFAVITVIVVVNFAEAQFEKGKNYLGTSIGFYFQELLPFSALIMNMP